MKLEFPVPMCQARPQRRVSLSHTSPKRCKATATSLMLIEGKVEMEGEVSITEKNSLQKGEFHFLVFLVFHDIPKFFSKAILFNFLSLQAANQLNHWLKRKCKYFEI